MPLASTELKLATVAQPPFVPNCVFIPKHAHTGAKPNSGNLMVDVDECTLLMAAHDHNESDCYTKEAWESYGRPSYRLAYKLNENLGCALDADGNEAPIEDGVVELLPEIWIAKLDERGYWCDEVRARTKTIHGVYAFNRMKRVYICSFEANYELTFLETQWDAVNDDAEREELYELFREGDAADRDNNSGSGVRYFRARDVDRWLETPCPRYDTPPDGFHGAYRFLEPGDKITAATEEDALLEVWETLTTSSL